MEAFGRTAVCTKCAQPFKIGASRPPFQWKNTDLAEDSWIGVPEPEEKKPLTKHCITCDAPLRPDMVACPECGTNQVTGVVRKPRGARRSDEDDRIPWWTMVPIRPIAIVVAVVLIAAGVFYVAKSLGRKGVELGDEMADAGMVKRAETQLNAGEDETTLAPKFAGVVKDANIQRFANMLASGSPSMRRAVTMLIAEGQQTNLEPVVAVARSEDPAAAQAGLGALWAIGPRRLVELSNHEDADAPARAAQARTQAAKALTMLFALDPADSRIAKLGNAMDAGQKTRLLNEICRPWPELIGTFAVTIGETQSRFTVRVDQVGKAFYLKTGRGEFPTDRGLRQFTIPIRRWCAATGSAVDARSVGELMSGVVVLTSPTGAKWEGQITVTARRELIPPLPGFLPLEGLRVGQTHEAPILLVRPTR